MAKSQQTEVTAMPAADTADALFELGMKYCIGHGIAQDLVRAHQWFNLAALRGSDAARQYRGELAREMTAAQVAEAQRLARDWLTVH